MNLFWKVFQLCIVTAVVFSHFAYDWGHGGSMIAVGAVAVFAAWLSTAILTAGYDLLRRAKSLLLVAEKRVNERRSSRG